MKMKYLTSLLLALALVAPACANSPTDRSIDDKANLQMTVQTFHKNMRWSRWESAAMVVAPAKRQEFLGRYDELGEDFHISSLEIKALSRLKDKAIVDIEQEYYKEPAMIVKKDRYIEVWEKTDGDWMLTERMLKDEFKAAHKGELEKARNKAIKRKQEQQQ